jgi:hypothetical protein
MIKLFGFFIGVATFIGILTAMFQGSQGGVSTVLTAELIEVETGAIAVASVEGFKSASVVIINNEIIRYTGTDTAGNCPAPVPALSDCFTGLTRSVGQEFPGNHAVGTRVLDQTIGLTNLQLQHEYATFSSDLEEGSNVSLNPFTWADALTGRVANFVPTFLTGNWAYVNVIFYFFMGLFVLIIALVMISVVRGVRFF